MVRWLTSLLNLCKTANRLTTGNSKLRSLTQAKRSMMRRTSWSMHEVSSTTIAGPISMDWGRSKGKSCIQPRGIPRMKPNSPLYFGSIRADRPSSYDYSGKRIGVIGSGSSAIQIVPQLQTLKDVKLSCFVRSKTWIARGFGESAKQKLQLDHENCRSYLKFNGTSTRSN